MAVGFGPSAGCHSRGNGDTAASLMFGGAPEVSSKPPVASAASNEPPAPWPVQRPGPRPGPRPLITGVADALSMHAPYSRMAVEVRYRRQRAPRRDAQLQYDDHVADVEEQAFSVLRHNLVRLERKADREHSMYEGSAGFSSEKSAERGDWEQGSGARPKLATPRGDNDSVASLISHAPTVAGHRPRSASPGRGSGSYAAPTCSSHRKSSAAPGVVVPPLRLGGGSESLASRIAS